MKTVIATAIALAVTAPAFADVSNAQAYFALGNDSAAERIVGDTSTGNPLAAEAKFALSNDSAVETKVLSERARSADVDVKAIQAFFALGNDSAAERIVK